MVFGLDDGTSLVYSDPRRFGVMDLFPESGVASHKLLKGIGVEPLGNDFNAEALAHAEDEIIRALFDFAGGSVYPPAKGQTPESIAVVAVGGYGRGTLAPGSDIDLLFVLPARQTPRIQSIVEFVLYSLWDMRQKVGHATRSVDECIRLAKTDSTILTNTNTFTYNNLNLASTLGAGTAYVGFTGATGSSAARSARSSSGVSLPCSVMVRTMLARRSSSSRR